MIGVFFSGFLCALLAVAIVALLSYVTKADESKQRTSHGRMLHGRMLKQRTHDVLPFGRNR